MHKTFPIEMTEELHKRAKIAAVQEGVTLHDWIVKALEEKLDHHEHNSHGAQKRPNRERHGA